MTGKAKAVVVAFAVLLVMAGTGMFAAIASL